VDEADADAVEPTTSQDWIEEDKFEEIEEEDTQPIKVKKKSPKTEQLLAEEMDEVGADIPEWLLEADQSDDSSVNNETGIDQTIDKVELVEDDSQIASTQLIDENEIPDWLKESSLDNTDEEDNFQQENES
jgi:hypothetical protein